jgi:urocanate hydratase
MLLDGTADTDRKIRSMLSFDVNNGIARRSWARNKGAMDTAVRAQQSAEDLQITLPFGADEKLLNDLIK